LSEPRTVPTIIVSTPIKTSPEPIRISSFIKLVFVGTVFKTC